ncbi:MAG: hypothetical protein ACOVNY_09725 [Chitinophagaceae bacterium]
MALEQALYHITGTEHLTDVTTEELANFSKTYPYFAPTHFLLGLKQKTEGSFSHVAQLQKSLMFFSNPMWMHLQLSQIAEFEEILSKEEAVSTASTTSQEYGFNNSSSEVLFKPDISLDDVEEGFVFPNLQEESTIESGFTFPNQQKEQPANSHSWSTFHDEKKQKDAQESPAESTNNFGNNQPLEIPTLETVRQMLEGKTVPSTKIAVPALEEKTIVSTIISEETEKQRETISTPSTSIPSYAFKGFGADDDVNGANAVALSEAAYVDEEAEVTENETSEPDFTNNISSVLSNQLVDFNKPVEKDSKLEFENEALHTIDYFAALGIKIDLTKQPQDKLTVQLRRFTDWLKQMKNVNPNPQDLGTDPELEKAIQNIAKTSIEAREIVTETMADVFIKQGKVDKAIQLYIKLSFLDPHKSTYFANRIQQLKGI